MNNKELIKFAIEYYYLSCLSELSDADSLRLQYILENSVNNIFLEKILFAIDDFLEDQEDFLDAEDLDKQKRIISKSLALNQYYDNLDHIEYSDIQYGQWVKKYYFLSRLDCLEEQDEKELETILEMANSNPIVSILIDFVDEIISEAESHDEEYGSKCEASRHLISLGLSFHFWVDRLEDYTSIKSECDSNDETVFQSPHFLTATECKSLCDQMHRRLEGIKRRNLSINVMELVVAKRVQYYLTLFSGGLFRHVSSKEIELYALNSLPALYASSEKGWQHQYSKAKDQLSGIIDSAVKKAIHEIVSSSKIKLDELQLYKTASPHTTHLQALSEILQSPSLSWDEVEKVAAQKLGLEMLGKDADEVLGIDFEPVSVGSKHFEGMNPELTSIRHFAHNSISERQFKHVYSPTKAASVPNLRGSGSDRLPRVVCVDDSTTIRQAVEHILGGHGYEATSIGNPLKALDLLSQFQPNLILCDITMPDLDGYELCSILRHSSAFRKTPIIMLTGKNGLLDRAKARMVGATDYLTKPFSPSVLLSLVKAYVGPGDLNRPRPEMLVAEVIEDEFDMS